MHKPNMKFCGANNTLTPNRVFFSFIWVKTRPICFKWLIRVNSTT